MNTEYFLLEFVIITYESNWRPACLVLGCDLMQFYADTL